MASIDLVNDHYINFFQTFNVSGNGTTFINGENTKHFNSGNLFFWGASSFTDGVHTLSFKESPDGSSGNATDISPDRIITPEYQLTVGGTPLVIFSGSPGMQDINTFSRQFSIRDLVLPFLHPFITSTGVTTGATFVIGLLGKTEYSPVSKKEIIPLP